jgi:hypothetical protein
MGAVIRFPGRFEAHVRRQMKAWASEDPARYLGTDWWQLSPAEEEVFQIDRERFPVMACALYAYETFKDIVQADDFGPEDVLHDARQGFPQWARLHVADEKEFIAFAAHFCGLTAREAQAIFKKHAFWHVGASDNAFLA